MRPIGLPRQSAEKTFESLYQRHFRGIFGYALALLDSPTDAEDATQATFLNAYRALQRGERPRQEASWLRAIALNVCREHFRRASRRPDEVSLEEDPGELVVDAPVPAIGDVVRALSHLPFNQRAALVMREFEGRSVAEIAGLLEVTNSAVETLLFRARRALREQLEGSLLCDEAERAISRQLDGALPRSERRLLRAHLRECPECASLARRLRAQRSALKSLALVPVPATLAWSKFAVPGAAGGTAQAAGASLLTVGAAPVAVKVIAPAVLAALAVGAGYVTLGHHAARLPAPRGDRDAALIAMGGRSVAAGAGVAASAPNGPTLGHGLTRASSKASVSLRSAAPQTPNGSRASGRAPGPGHGHGHAYGGSRGTAHGRAGPAPGTLRRPPHPPTAHGQPRGNGRGRGIAHRHSAGGGHGRAGLAKTKPPSPTGRAPGQAQPSGNPGQGHMRTQPLAAHYYG